MDFECWIPDWKKNINDQLNQLQNMRKILILHNFLSKCIVVISYSRRRYFRITCTMFWLIWRFDIVEKIKILQYTKLKLHFWFFFLEKYSNKTKFQVGHVLFDFFWKGLFLPPCLPVDACYNIRYKSSVTIWTSGG